MEIQSTRIVKSIGSVSKVKELLNDTGAKIEASETDADANGLAFTKLGAVASIFESDEFKAANFTINLDIAGSQEGILAASNLMQGISENALKAPSKTELADLGYNAPISISPTVGGMGLGLVGGYGLGIAIDALRNTANASGNPVLSSLAIGLGLAGTAIGGLIGHGGSFEIELPGLKLAAQSSNFAKG